MAVTATKAQTLKDVLNTASPNMIADALQAVALGSILAPVSETISQAASTTVALSSAALCPAVVTVRVTGGASLGAYLVVDSAGVAVDVGAEIGVCLLAADGKSLIFNSNVTDCVVTYVAAPATALDSLFAY